MVLLRIVVLALAGCIGGGSFLPNSQTEINKVLNNFIKAMLTMDMNFITYIHLKRIQVGG